MNSKNDNQGNTVIVNQQERESNGIGTAGFVLALISLFISWIPIFGWILWLLGLILSFVGVFKKPKGLAIAGLAISMIWVIVVVMFLGAIATSL